MKKFLALAFLLSVSGAQALTNKYPGNNNGTLIDQPSKPTNDIEMQEEEDFSDMTEAEKREDRRQKAYDKSLRDAQRSKKSPRSGTNTVTP